MTFNEFKTNSPSIEYFYELKQEGKKYSSLMEQGVVTYYSFDFKKEIERDKKKKFRETLSNCWGFSDGKKCYAKIEGMRRFVEIKYIGRYCYYKFAVTSPGLYDGNTGMVYGGGTSLKEVVVDFNTGKLIPLSKSKLRKLIDSDVELLERFENQEKKSRYLQEYIVEYSDHNYDDIEKYEVRQKELKEWKLNQERAKREAKLLKEEKGLDSLIVQQKGETDGAYKARMLSYKVRRAVLEVESVRSTYSNGSVKLIGIKMRHIKGAGGEFLYKVGTWKYYHKNGELKRIVTYNLIENKEGEFKEFSDSGELLRNEVYRDGVVVGKK